MHWTEEYGEGRPIAVRWYRSAQEMENDMNFIALTPGNRWNCETPIIRETYGYTCVYNRVPDYS